MLNNLNRRKGYTEVLYNYRTEKFFTDAVGNEFQELDLNLASDNEIGSALQPGDNVSLLFNDAGYLQTGQGVSILSNDAGYITAGADISIFNNDVNFVSSGAGVSTFVNDAGYITSSDIPNPPVTSVNNKTGEVVLSASDVGAATTAQGGLADTAIQPNDSIKTLTNDAYFVSQGDNISVLTNNSGFITKAFPLVDALPDTNLNFGDVCALTTDKFPYFYDGENWRKFNLYGVPTTDPPADADWDRVLCRISFDPEDVPSGSTALTEPYDIKANSYLNRYGECTIQGAPSKFGGGAAKFKSSGNFYLNAGNTSVIKDFLNDEFTIEFWLYINENGTTGEPFSVWEKINTCSFCLQFNGTGAHWMYIVPEGARDDENSTNWGVVGVHTFTLKTWYHIALVRNTTDGLATLYVNGTEEDISGSDIFNSINDNLNNVMMFGDQFESSADFYLDDIRISKFQRYTSNFLAPSEKFPTGPGEE